MSRWPVVLLVVALMAVVPAAVPQGPMQPEYLMSLEVVPHGHPIAPMTEQVVVPFTLTVSCTTLSIPALVPLVISLAAWADQQWMSVTLSPSTVTIQPDLLDCAQGVEHTEAGTVSLSVSADAPAFASAHLRLRAQTDYGVEAEQGWSEKAGLYFRSQVFFERSSFRADANELVAIPIVFTNFGNGAVAFRTVVKDETSSQLNVMAPGLSVVPAGEQRAHHVEVHTPYRVAETRQDQIVLEVTPVSADDPALVDARFIVTAIVHTSPGSPGLPGEELPAAPLPFALALLGIAALALRRRS